MGEKFSECFADKIDQMQTRLPAAKISVHMWRPAEWPLPQVPTILVPAGLLGVSREAFLRAKPTPCHCHQSQQRDKSPKSTNWVIEEEKRPPNVFLREFAHRHEGRSGQCAGTHSCALGVDLHPLHCSATWVALLQEIQGTVSTGIHHQGTKLRLQALPTPM